LASWRADRKSLYIDDLLLAKRKQSANGWIPGRPGE
jgi:hypothetical protein